MSESNGFLDRAAFLGATSLKTETIDALGGKVMIRALSTNAAQSLNKRVNKDDKAAMVLWVVASVVDPHNMQPMFTDADRESLGQLPVSDMMKISQAAISLNGFTGKDAEEDEKN